MTQERDHSPLPWALEIEEGGPLTGVDAEIAEAEECEAYALSTAKIVSTTEFTRAKRWNEETKAWDIPIPRTFAEIVFDPREGQATKNQENAAFIIRACNNHYKLVEALKACIKHLEEDFPSDDVDETVYLDARQALAEAESA